MSLPPWSTSDVIVEGVYSHAVPPELQTRKLFALESMHDLRLSPTEQATCNLPEIKRRDDYPRVPSVDYFRRGVRSEELFFVYSLSGVRELVRSFVAQLTRPTEDR
jgi:hypothetical protein